MAGAEKGHVSPNLIAVIVIAAVLVAAGAGYALWQDGQDADGGDALYARVHDADGTTTELALASDGETVIESSLGRNVLVVKAGAVHVESATCENKDCIRQGEISRPGEQIICLPNQMWVEIVHEGDPDGQMDANATPQDDAASDLDATAR